MSTSMTSNGPRTVSVAENAGVGLPAAGRGDAPAARAHAFHKIPGLFDDAVLLLSPCSCSLIILLVGAPIATFVRVVIEIAHRF